jgi:FtsP/CotA-like multicopper oxidase with cupredoxin domain
MQLINFPILPILDLTNNDKKKLNANFKIIKTKHKFSTKSVETGNDPIIPIFGCEYWVSDISKHSDSISNNSIINSTTFGLPLIIVNQNQIFDINMDNQSGYVLNIHYHGINFNAFNDGASDACLFGKNTQIGLINKLNCKMNNNSSLCWYHPHNMYQASEFIYMGMIGLIQIINKLSYKIDNFFEQNNNHLILTVVDIDINDDGTLNKDNLYTDQWRGKYTAVNGINCVNWESDDMMNINNFYHETTKNIVKLSLLQGVCSWRRYFIGICDKNNNIKKWYLIETDDGYRNPIQENTSSFSAGSRISVMFDLNDFEDNEAYIFFYNYDITKNNGLIYDNILLNPITDLSGNIIETIPFPCGYSPTPNNPKIKKFLKIKQHCKTNYNITKTIKLIQKIVFGNNYKIIKKMNNIELKLNYWKYLNPKYFYNLPCFSNNVPKRRYIFFSDNNQISLINNSTEFFNGQNRIFIDMLNSKEYTENMIPTCLFKIKKYGQNYDKYINYNMDSNHHLIINLFDIDSNLIESIEINFPSTNKPLNIKEWTNLVNKEFNNVKLYNTKYTKLSEILEYKWKLVKYKVPYLSNSIGEYYKQPACVYSIQIFNINKSNDIIIELKAKFSLLNFFGKPFGVMNNMDMDMEKGMDNLQQLFIYAGSISGNPVMPDKNNNFKIIISPKTQYNGYIDGILNDNLMNFSVKQESSELWIYNNLDNQDSHPLHFHMTSGFARFDNKYSSECLKNNQQSNMLEYSKDVYSIGPQQKISFNIKFVNHSSNEGQIKWLGYMYHCHFMAHHDMSMMGQFFVYKNKFI